MKVSIIIPTFQREQFLLDTLTGVRAQEFPRDECEILLVDNSPQPSAKLSSLRDLKGTPKVHCLHEPRNGLHNARHAGARIAKGEILVYIDDDVLCPPQWLAAMLEPYRYPKVAMVAGKVKLAFESEPPPWVRQFYDILSALDWGDTAHALAPYLSPVGCNMSVRRSVLFAVKGFNPDAFGDRRLIHLRGDGECGLAHKIHEAGFLVWYAPQAWLQHRVPASRMTRQYIRQRSALSGMEAAYADLRYHNRSAFQIGVRAGISLSKYFYHRLQAIRHGADDERRLYHEARASCYFSTAYQRSRQTISAKLRQYTKLPTYL